MDWYFDENFSRFMVNAMDILEAPEGKHRVFHTKVEMVRAGFTSESIGDPEVIPWIAEKRGVLITKDKRQTTNRALFTMLHDYKLIVFFLPQSVSAKHWEQMLFVMGRWSKMKNAVRSKQGAEGPHFFTVRTNGDVIDWEDER